MNALPAVAVGLGLLLMFEGLVAPRRNGARRPPTTPVLQVGAAFGGAAAAYLLTRWPVLIVVGGVLGAATPRLLSEHRTLEQRLELTEALADAAAGLRDAVRGGLGLSDGMAGLAVYGPPLLREELAVLAADAGRNGVAAAAARFARRLNNPGADLLAATLAFNDRVGGKQVTEVLDAIADELIAEARTLRELRARQARQRASARVVALAPLALLLILRHVNAGYLEPYEAPAGQAVLGLAALLIAAGYALMLRIARTIEPPRIVVGEPS